MKGSIIIKGHSLQHVDSKEPYKARCSCGAWGTIAGAIKADARAHGARNWHDDHKREVWRRLHPEDFEDDRPLYADMENKNEE